MSEIKNIKKFENDDIQVLSIDDLEGEKSSSLSLKENKKKSKWRRILFAILIILVMILVSGIGVFVAFRSMGEKSLKAEAKNNTILHNGKEYKYREDVINILCLGIDKAEPMERKIESRNILGMADAILLVSIDTKKNTVKIIAIPRDTMTNVTVTSETGESLQKAEMQLCYQYGYGMRTEQSNELMVDAVSGLLFGVPIEKYCAINFEALPVLNDAIGGVDIVVQEELAEYEPEFVYGRQLHLEGELALKYVRVRNKTSIDSVVLRTQRQKQYAVAFLEKAKSVVANDLTLPVKIFQELQENMSTNVSIPDITYLVPELLEVDVSEDIIQILPGESVAGEDFLEFHTDKEAVKELVINTFYEAVEKGK